jgi:hypothetical protein
MNGIKFATLTKSAQEEATRLFEKYNLDTVIVRDKNLASEGSFYTVHKSTTPIVTESNDNELTFWRMIEKLHEQLSAKS